MRISSTKMALVAVMFLGACDPTDQATNLPMATAIPGSEPRSASPSEPTYRVELLGCEAFDPPNGEVNTNLDLARSELVASYLDPKTAEDVNVLIPMLDPNCLRRAPVARVVEHALIASQRYGPCRWRDNVIADVDGDDRPDLVFHDWIRGRAVLGVCTAARQRDRAPGYGQAEALFFHDVDEDGADEIFFGATTISAEIVHVARFIDNRLREIRPPGGGVLELVRGLDYVRSSLVRMGGAIGCADTDGDGIRNLMAVGVGRGTRGRLHASIVGYHLDGRFVRQISREMMTFRGIEGPNALVRQAQAVADPC